MQSSQTSTPPGFGEIELRSAVAHTALSKLVSSYPLKLLSPRTPHPNVAVVYVLTYGGGLVAGDRISLHASVHDGTVLVLLTQVCSIMMFRKTPIEHGAIASGRDLRRSSSHVQAVDLHDLQSPLWIWRQIQP